MKIEKINENQIRCTLNKADLADKELLLNELAYGTDKAKELFREMMTQAYEELGFEVDDIPLMIEAIPVSPECLILNITKVSDPEELDTRFSRFSRVSDYSEEDDDEDHDLMDTTDENIMDVLDELVSDIETSKNSNPNSAFIPLPESIKKRAIAANKDKADSARKDRLESYRVYRFRSINDISEIAPMLSNIYDGDNSLFKNPADKQYYLLISLSSNKNQAFTRVCNILGEYGTKLKTTYATPYHYNEHFKVIIKQNALQTLAKL